MYELKFVGRHSTLIIPVTDGTQTIATSVQKFPDCVVKSVRRADHGQSRCVSEMIRLSISLRVAFFLHVMYIEKMLIFNFMFYLLWGVRGSSEGLVVSLGFHEPKSLEKHGYERFRQRLVALAA
jgi:hypothetical protein